MTGNRRTVLGGIIIGVLLCLVFYWILQKNPKKLIVPDMYKSINSAISQARKGDTVFVKAGTYDEGTIFLRDSIKLIGEDKSKVILRNDASLKKHVIFASCPTGLIRGLTIEQFGEDKDERRSVGIFLSNSSMEVKDCIIRKTAGNGIAVKGKGKPVITNCIIESSGFCGIFVMDRETEPIIRGNIIRGNLLQGITIRNSRESVVENNVCKDNRSGILVMYKGAYSQLINNHCLQNKKYGIYISTEANSLVESNICEKNSKSGIFVCKEGTNALVKNNKCTDNGEHGIHFLSGSQGTIVNNVCKANGKSGIRVRAKRTKTTIKNNDCSYNQINGITFRDAATGRIEGNNCYKNKYHGISVYQNGVSAIVKNNKCLDNEMSGIYFSTYSAGSATGNTCSRNKWYGISVNDLWSFPVIKDNNCLDNEPNNVYIAQGEFGAVRQLLVEEKFEKLEEVVARLRKEKSRSYTGWWQLSHFYNYLGWCWAFFEPSREEWLFDLIDKWIEEKPESVTPRIVKANAYMDFAWQARGGGFASTVTEESWKIFNEKLKKAWAVLVEAEELNANDPEFYNIFIKAALGLGKDRIEVERLFEKGVRIECAYYPLYVQMANYLQPKWHGEEGDLKKFADKTVGLAKECEGLPLYAIITELVIPKSKDADPNDFLTYKFSYEHIKQGLEDILERYPNADYYRNIYCLVASIHKDKKTARKLFDKIGDNWNKTAWSYEKHFRKYKKWAYDN